MISRASSLSLFLATVLPLAAQQPPQVVPVEEPPKAAPVEDPAAPVPPDEGPKVVPGGGNVPRPQAEEKAISRSGMFRVSGGDRPQRSSVALVLEQTKDNFEALMREKVDPSKKPEEKNSAFVTPEVKLDDFKWPVDVLLVGKPGDPPKPRSVAYDWRFTNASFLLGIQIYLARGIDNEQLERASLTMLLYERALRSANPEGFDDVMVVRPWLVEGLIEANKWRNNRADRRLYEGVFRQGGGFTLDELFELSDNQFAQLDTASKLSFRALSGALVMALLDQPDGRGAFKSFCGEAARFSGEMPVLLRKYFPQLNLSEKSLAKWWALTLAKLVQPKLSESLSIQDTERSLNDGLQFHTRDADGNAVNRDIAAWQAIAALKPPERAEAVRPAEDAMSRLSYRCFPSYRAILNEYQQILRDLVAGKTGEIEKRVSDLAEQRRIRVERATRARDYMDFIEISQARELSGEFDDYLRLKKELELRPRPERHDRVTQTLDTMQKAYESRRKR